MEEEVATWLSNIINYLIFVYIFIGSVNTACFNIFDISLALIGLASSIMIQFIYAIINLLKAK